VSLRTVSQVAVLIDAVNCATITSFSYRLSAGLVIAPPLIISGTLAKMNAPSHFSKNNLEPVSQRIDQEGWS